ncbi:hypothetical protein [Virgibacillus alimentarius]|nr:hypothetical protein [Virgibacillus alimentarius]
MHASMTFILHNYCGHRFIVKEGKVWGVKSIAVLLAQRLVIPVT